MQDPPKLEGGEELKGGQIAKWGERSILQAQLRVRTKYDGKKR